MDYLSAKKILLDEAIIVTDLKADSKIQALRESVRLLYDKKYGHDCIGDLLARIIEHEKRGSYLIAEGVALPHLYISDGEFEERAGWFIIRNGIEYGNIKEKVFVFLLCIGSEKFVKSVTAVGLELCKNAEFVNRVKRVSAFLRISGSKNAEISARNFIARWFNCYISGGLLTLFEVNKQKEMAIEGDDVVNIDLTLKNKLGLHARASGKFVLVASSFESEIRLERGGRNVNAKSITECMMLAAGRGTQLRLKAKGPDAELAIYTLSELIKQKFGEDD